MLEPLGEHHWGAQHVSKCQSISPHDASVLQRKSGHPHSLHNGTRWDWFNTTPVYNTHHLPMSWNSCHITHHLFMSWLSCITHTHTHIHTHTHTHTPIHVIAFMSYNTHTPIHVIALMYITHTHTPIHVIEFTYITHTPIHVYNTHTYSCHGIHVYNTDHLLMS